MQTYPFAISLSGWSREQIKRKCIKLPHSFIKLRLGQLTEYKTQTREFWYRIWMIFFIAVYAGEGAWSEFVNAKCEANVIPRRTRDVYRKRIIKISFWNFYAFSFLFTARTRTGQFKWQKRFFYAPINPRTHLPPGQTRNLFWSYYVVDGWTHETWAKGFWKRDPRTIFLWWIFFNALWLILIKCLGHKHEIISLLTLWNIT